MGTDAEERDALFVRYGIEPGAPSDDAARDRKERDALFARYGIGVGVSLDQGRPRPSAESASSRPPAGDLALTANVINSRAIGGIFRVRHGFRSEPFIVVGQTATHYKGIWPSGETELRPHARLGDALVPVPASVRSYAGRLWNLVRVPRAPHHLTDASAREVRKLLDGMLRDPKYRHAVGVLLDRHGLSLTEAGCLGLPLEPWRVRYELLQDYAAGTKRSELAAQVVADDDAPRGVRLRVALAEGLDLAPLGPGVATLFNGAPVTVRAAQMTDVRVIELAGALEAAGSPEAARLRVAVSNPSWFAASSHQAAALAVLSGRQLPPEQKVWVDGMPTSVVDDLIDADAPVQVSEAAGATEAEGMPGVALAAYITGRSRPGDLTTDEVVHLKFANEAYRRYLAGDDAVAAALPALRLADAKVARALKRGEDPSEEPQDPILAELLQLVRSGGELLASEALLADPSTWAALVAKGVDGGDGPGREQFADLAALHHARTALFEWDWGRAQSIAHERLRGAKREAIRDELLNIVACAAWLQGKPEPALAALDRALEGDYTDALLTNAAVVATELEHESAIDRFVKIAREAPGPHQRAMAAERALLLWVNDEARIWDDDDEGIPDEILGALRPLIGEPIPDERYLRIMKTLAGHDDNWLAAQPNGAFGPHANSAVVRIFKARANGIDDFAAALATELKTGRAERWVEEERDAVVSAAINILAEQNDEMSAAFFGMTLLKAGIPLEPTQQIPLVCFTVLSITQNIDTDEGEPKDEFIDWVFGAKHALSRLDSEQRTTFDPVVTMAGEALARSYAMARAPQISQAIEVFNTINSQLRTMFSWQINHEAVQQVMAPIFELCVDTRRVLNKVRPLVKDREVLRFVDDLMGTATQLGDKAVKIR